MLRRLSAVAALTAALVVGGLGVANSAEAIPAPNSVVATVTSCQPVECIRIAQAYSFRHSEKHHVKKRHHHKAVVQDNYVSNVVVSTSAFQACVIARESGGNPQIMNSTGHYGLYQFSYSTWIAYGGSPSTFGHATVAEQNQVFANAMAVGGESNWAPYDGC